MIRTSVIVFAILTCAGCTAPVPKTELYNIDQHDTKVNFDNRLLQECPPLPIVTDVTDTAIIDNYSAITQQYAACRLGKKALNDAIRDIFDLKDDGTAVVKTEKQIKPSAVPSPVTPTPVPTK